MAKAIITILIADDHAVVRRGLAMVLNLEPDFQVVAEAENGVQAIEIAGKLHPDIILLDLVMPIMDGYAAAAQLKKDFPNIKVIILTGTEDEENIIELIESGIDGYIFKDVEPKELKGAIRSVIKGEAYLDPSIIEFAKHHADQENIQRNLPALTPREREVLKWLGTPNTYREIAIELEISEGTIRSHAKSILHKLNQKNRAQAVLFALQYNMIDLPK